MYVLKHDVWKVVSVPKGEFSVETIYGTHYGHTDNDILIENLKGEQRIVDRSDFMSNSIEVQMMENKKLCNFTYEEICRGYELMGKLNKELAEEGLYADNEAHELQMRLLKG